MIKIPEAKGDSTIAEARVKVQEQKETPKRAGSGKEQIEARSNTDPEDYTTPLPLLPEDEEGAGLNIQRKRRPRTKSDTESLTDRFNTPHRKDMKNAKRKLESPEEREENKNKNKTEEETQKEKAENEFLAKFSRSRRISRSPPRALSTGRRENWEQAREKGITEKLQTDEERQSTMMNKGEKAENKEQQSTNEQLALILQEIKLMRDEGTETRTAQEEIKKELMEWKAEMTKELEKTNDKWENNRNEIEGMKEIMGQLETKVEESEERTRRLEEEIESKVDEDEVRVIIGTCKREKEEEDRKEVERIKEEVRKTREELEELKEREEKNKKRNNIIVYGKEAEGIKDKEELKEWIKEKLEVEVVWRTREYGERGRRRKYWEQNVKARR